MEVVVNEKVSILTFLLDHTEIAWKYLLFAFFLQPLKYPKSVFIILIYVFCEMFSWYSTLRKSPLSSTGLINFNPHFISEFLMEFLTKENGFDENTAVIILFYLDLSSYVITIIGASISDSFLGKFKAIIIFSFVYMLGYITLSIVSLSSWKPTMIR